MALRIRKDGRIFCAAMHPEEPGDTYINDSLHYRLSVELRVIVTEPADKHKLRGLWWWCNEVPDGVEIDSFYLEDKCQRPKRPRHTTIQQTFRMPNSLHAALCDMANLHGVSLAKYVEDQLTTSVNASSDTLAAFRKLKGRP